MIIIIQNYKDRTIEEGQKVDVYRNLNNGLFSIRDHSTKLVLAHGEDFFIRDCKMNVMKKGRMRVQEEMKKNVHAWITGYFTYDEIQHDAMFEVYYNPYETTGFIDKYTCEILEKTKDAYFKNGKCYRHK